MMRIPLNPLQRKAPVWRVGCLVLLQKKLRRRVGERWPPTLRRSKGGGVPSAETCMGMRGSRIEDREIRGEIGIKIWQVFQINV